MIDIVSMTRAGIATGIAAVGLSGQRAGRVVCGGGGVAILQLMPMNGPNRNSVVGWLCYFYSGLRDKRPEERPRCKSVRHGASDAIVTFCRQAFSAHYVYSVIMFHLHYMYTTQAVYQKHSSLDLHLCGLVSSPLAIIGLPASRSTNHRLDQNHTCPSPPMTGCSGASTPNAHQQSDMVVYVRPPNRHGSSGPRGHGWLVETW